MQRARHPFLTALLLFATNVAAQTTVSQPVGVSYYAIQSFSAAECRKALKVFDGVTTPALVMLWGTFGTNNNCVTRYLTTYGQGSHVLEVHITNNTCLRGRICRNGEVVRGVGWHQYNKLLEEREPLTMNALRARIHQIVSYLAKARGPQTRLILSTGLEDNYTAAAYDVVKGLLEDARTVTPFEIVRNPFKISLRTNPDADLLEGHGFKPALGAQWFGRCIANNDGYDITFRGPLSRGERHPDEVPSFIETYKSKECLVFLWWSGPQGLTNTKPRLTPHRRFYDLRIADIAKINSLIKETQALQITDTTSGSVRP